MKKRLLLGAVITAIAAVNSYAQIPPCPDCVPCTNCPPYTNTFTPTEYPLDTLLLRVASIVNSTNGLVSTNYGWFQDTNNLLMSAGGTGFDGSMAAGFSSLTYNLAITNTSPYRVYAIQYSPTVNGIYTNVTGVFIGTTNSSEYLASVVLPNSSASGFLRVQQQDGYISWAQAWTNGINGNFPGSCPGPYHGYINYVFHIPQWGYLPITNLTDHTATDLREPTNKLELVTDYGYTVCDTGTVDWTNSPTLNPPLYGRAARFSVFFKTYPTNQAYPLWIRGYYPPTNGYTPFSIIGGGGTPLQVQPFEELDDIQATNIGITDFMTK